MPSVPDQDDNQTKASHTNNQKRKHQERERVLKDLDKHDADIEKNPSSLASYKGDGNPSKNFLTNQKIKSSIKVK